MARATKPPKERIVLPTARIKYESITLGPSSALLAANARIHRGALEELTTAIDRSGWVSPLMVWLRKDGKYEIIQGERRYCAVGVLRERDKKEKRQTRFDSLDCQIFDGTELYRVKLNYVENTGRRALSLFETASRLAAVKKRFSMNTEDAARLLSISKSYAYNCCKILDNLHPDILKHLKRGANIPAATLYDWVRHKPDKQVEKFDRWLQKSRVKPTAPAETEQTPPPEKPKPKMIRWSKAESYLKKLQTQQRRGNLEVTPVLLDSVKYLMGLRKKPPI